MRPECFICQESFISSEKVVLVILGPTVATNESISSSHKGCFLSNKIQWAESLATAASFLVVPDAKQKARLRELEAAEGSSLICLQDRGRLGLFTGLVEEWAATVQPGSLSKETEADTANDARMDEEHFAEIPEPQMEQQRAQIAHRPWLVLEEIDALHLDQL